MSIYDRNSISQCYGYMIGLNPDDWSISLVSVVNRKVPLATTTLEEQPEIGVRGREGSWNLSKMGPCWNYIVQEKSNDDSVRREEERSDHGCHGIAQCTDDISSHRENMG